MADIPGNSTTTATITVGGTKSDSLEAVGDHDWFKISLTAGQSISVAVDGIALEDSYLRIYDSSGNLLYENDDITSGVVRDSLLAFTATYTGTYYIDVGAFDDAYAGTYQLSVSNYSPPPLGTVDDLADQLTDGYWGGDSHHFDVTQGGTITVNLTALTAAGQSLALAALATWTDIIGVNFVPVSSGGQIVFDDNEEGAFSEGVWSDGIISSAHVNVSAGWLSDYGTGLSTYSFQTYIHEIGHALGLGHQGNYNGDGRYPFDAKFQNDCWAMSVMSYFSQAENSYFAGQGFDENFLVTPMMADILAMSVLYGLSTTTRAGNDIYGYASGWHANMGALCIFDNGGIDTIDVAGLGGNQLINLNPGTFSNIMDEVGNVSIAIGVIIENATSSSGSDTLIGNDVANILTSGGGNDTLRGGAGDDWLVPGWGNNVLDGGSGMDTVDYIEGMTAGGISINLALGTATNNGGAGSDTLTSIENVQGTTYDDTIIGNNVANVLEGHHGNDTINGGDGDDRLIGDTDGLPMIAYSDVLDGGAGSDLLTGNLGSDIMTGGAGNDTFIDSAAGLSGDTITDFTAGDKIVITNATLATFSYSLSGSTLTYTGGTLTLTGFTGKLTASAAAGGGVQLTLKENDARNDFNGDGRSDILWRNDAGIVTDWLGQANGSFVGNTSSFIAGTNWTIAGTGDFNGDGRDDVLWRNNGTGVVTDWLGQANGSFVGNTASFTAGTNWSVIGTGDFNGDGRDDVLWRNNGTGVVTDWFGQANGSFIGNTASFTAGNNWSVLGTGDFNGDNRDDVLWRNEGTGVVTSWFGQANGTFVGNTASFTAGNNWSVVGTGDFNGDNRDDVLWRNDDHIITSWFGQTNGSFVGNTASFTADGSWSIEGTGDFNGDGIDDVLWRSDAGIVTDWLGQANGSFLGNFANAHHDVTSPWQVQPDHYLI